MRRHLQRASYGIYVRFRRSRLPLRRGIDTLEHALVAAAALRASRFHDRGDIFVVKEPEGTIVEPDLADPPSPPQPPAPPSSPEAPPDEARHHDPHPPASDPMPQARPAGPAARPSSLPPGAAIEDRAEARVAVLAAQLGQSQRAIARARAAQERFERAYAEAERALRVYGGRADEAILSHRARIVAARDLSARTVACCEQSAALIAERLDATRRSRPA